MPDYLPEFPDDPKARGVGPLVVAAILRGVPRAALRHRIQQLKGSAWGKVADAVSPTRNGSGGEKLLEAFEGVRVVGRTEAETRRQMLAEVAHFDQHVDTWLAEDPEFKRRNELPMRSLAEVAGMFDEIEWVWEGWIPVGFLSMIAGVPGVGKSFVAQWIAGNLVLGGQFPDGTQCPEDQGRKILWIDTEGTTQLLVERAREMGIPGDRFIWPLDPKHPTEDFPAVDLSKDYWVGLVSDFALRVRPAWIVVDALRGAHSMDENSSDVQKMLGYCAALARDVKCGFSFVHHLRKRHPGENEVTMEMVRGSSALAAMMRVIVAVDAPDPLSDEIRLRLLKSNLGKKPDPVGLRLEDSGPVRLDGAPSAPRRLTAVELAAEFLRLRLEKGPVASVEIFAEAAEKGISKASITRARYQLNIVPVKMEGHWEWSLPARREEEEPF